MARARPVFARIYARVSPRFEDGEIGAHRDELVAELHGRVLELGCGNGLTFAHYPASVRAVVAVEPEPYLRREAQTRAASAPVPVAVVGGEADRIPVADATFDAAVASLVLCSVPDQARALGELRRILRPGGELRFYEHVAGEGTRRRVQGLLDATVWPRVAGGCHLGRDTEAAVARAGFTLDAVRRFAFQPGWYGYPVAPHVIGRASRG